MITVSLNFEDEQGQALGPAVKARAAELMRNPDVLARLPEGLAASEVQAWPVVRQAKLVLYAHLMMLRQRHDRKLAAVEAGEAAALAARDGAAFEVA